MEKRLWDVYTPPAQADAIVEGLKVRIKALAGRVTRTTRAQVKGEIRVHVALETPEGAEAVFAVVKWIARQGGTVTGS